MKIQLVEPKWGEEFLIGLNQYLNTATLKSFVPLFADGIVFLYPVFLIIFYLKWVFKNQKDCKRYAVLVFLSVVVGIVITLLIQQFVDKTRPENLLDKNMLLLQHLPSISFPSDHATIGFAFAFGLLVAWFRLGKKQLKIIGSVFLLLAILMGLARIGAWVHRPTDIWAGALIGLIGTFLVFGFERFWLPIADFLISIENQTLGKVFKLFAK